MFLEWVISLPWESTGLYWIYWKLSNELLFWLYSFCLQLHVKFPPTAFRDPIATSSALHPLGTSVPFGHTHHLLCTDLYTQTLGVDKFLLHFSGGFVNTNMVFIKQRNVSLTSLTVQERNWDTDALSKSGPGLGPREWKPDLPAPHPDPGIPSQASLVADNYSSQCNHCITFNE